MSIQAITGVNNKPVEINKKPELNIVAFEPMDSDIPQETDILINSQSPEILEAKYDFACRLAAYYKQQYDNLKQTGYCIA